MKIMNFVFFLQANTYVRHIKRTICAKGMLIDGIYYTVNNMSNVHNIE